MVYLTCNFNRLVHAIFLCQSICMRYVFVVYIWSDITIHCFDNMLKYSKKQPYALERFFIYETGKRLAIYFTIFTTSWLHVFTAFEKKGVVPCWIFARGVSVSLSIIWCSCERFWNLQKKCWENEWTVYIQRIQMKQDWSLLLLLLLRVRFALLICHRWVYYRSRDSSNFYTQTIISKPNFLEKKNPITSHVMKLITFHSLRFTSILIWQKLYSDIDI